MQFDRLEEIIYSDENHKVMYHGHPVWIEGYNKTAKIAQVRFLDSKVIEGAYVRELSDTGEII